MDIEKCIITTGFVHLFNSSKAEIMYQHKYCSEKNILFKPLLLFDDVAPAGLFIYIYNSFYVFTMPRVLTIELTNKLHLDKQFQQYLGRRVLQRALA